VRAGADCRCHWRLVRAGHRSVHTCSSCEHATGKRILTPHRCHNQPPLDGHAALALERVCVCDRVPATHLTACEGADARSARRSRSRRDTGQQGSESRPGSRGGGGSSGSSSSRSGSRGGPQAGVSHAFAQLSGETRAQHSRSTPSHALAGQGTQSGARWPMQSRTHAVPLLQLRRCRVRRHSNSRCHLSPSNRIPLHVCA
jgi:hypothetical protein